MIRKILLAAVLMAALPLVGQYAHATDCDTWNAATTPDGNPHHVIGPVGGTNYIDVVGGKGYGSGNHQDDKKNATPTGKYGDPKRDAAQGGYVQGRIGTVTFNVNFFGPLDETDTTHTYDTVGGACVSNGGTPVQTGEKCVPTSILIPPNSYGPYNCTGY